MRRENTTWRYIQQISAVIQLVLLKKSSLLSSLFISFKFVFLPNQTSRASKTFIALCCFSFCRECCFQQGGWSPFPRTSISSHLGQDSLEVLGVDSLEVDVRRNSSKKTNHNLMIWLRTTTNHSSNNRWLSALTDTLDLRAIFVLLTQCP